MFKEKRTYLDYIKDINEEIKNIEKFTDKLSYENLIKDKKTVYAIVRCFEIIGEAVKNIPLDIRKKYSNIPWGKMSGMRDKLIHEYFGVDFGTLWQTIKLRIPEIRPLIQKLLKEMNKRQVL